MPEIRNEAHIKCEVLSNALIAPGVRAMIEEPVPVDYVFVTGTAVMKDEGNNRAITLDCGFEPRIVYLYGYTTESYRSSSSDVYQAITISMAADLKKLELKGGTTRYSRTKYTNSTSYSYNNSRYEITGSCEYQKNEDGTITLRFGERTGISSLKYDMNLTFYAGYTNESPEAYDAGYAEGFEAGYQAGYEEGKMKNAVLGTAVLNQMVLV